MTQLQKVRRIIASTPGSIANAVFEQAGVSHPKVMRLAGMVSKNGMWRVAG